MLAIMDAISKIGLEGAFYGNEPTDISQITDEYLSAIVEVNGFMTSRLTVNNGSVSAAEIVSVIQENEPDELYVEIKQAALEKILEHFPEWRQRNYTARALELNYKLVVEGSVTEQEQEEMDAILAVWEWVKLVRITSNQAELDLTPVDAIVWPVFVE